MHLGVLSNFMDRPNHLICLLTSCSVFPASLSVPLSSPIYVTRHTYNLKNTNNTAVINGQTVGIGNWCYRLIEQWNLIGLLVNFRLTQLSYHTMPDIAVFTVHRKIWRYLQLVQACQDSDSSLPVAGWACLKILFHYGILINRLEKILRRI